MIHPYLWIAIVGGIFSFLVACGNGANDLANAFGTSYGSKVLRLRHIVVIAAVCEFGGAVGLGSQVTATMASGIASPTTFAAQPYVMMYGMLCTLISACVWLFAATYWSLPVSSTHSIAGGIIGYALVFGGRDAVIWAGHKNDFPFVSGVVPIVVSWFASPVLTGIVAVIIYCLVRYLVLQPKNCVQRAVYTLPIVVLVTFFLEAFFILYKGAANRLKWSVNKAAWVAAIIGAGVGLLSIAFIPLLLIKVRRMTEEAERRAREENRAVEDVEQDIINGNRGPAHDAEGANASLEKKDGAVMDGEEMKRGSSSSEPIADAVAGADGTQQDSSSVAFTSVEKQQAKGKFHRAKIFDQRAEYVFRYLQVFTAICTSFAHGAGDVSNAIGPYSAIYNIYQTQGVGSNSEVPIWLLCLGGAGIVTGLATYGLNIIRLLGEKITLITPSRGFSAELATALVVSLASGYGIPVSSTHCITGAVVSISIVDVGICHVQWKMVLKMYAGWIFTIFITGLISAVIFAQGVYAPFVYNPTA